MFIELTKEEIDLLVETNIIYAYSKKDLVQEIHDYEDIESYCNGIINREETFVDWYYNTIEAKVIKDNIYFATYNNGFDKKVLESIVDKIFEFKSEKLHLTFDEILYALTIEAEKEYYKNEY